MTDRSRPQPIPICTFGFNIPCRRFLVTANVTRDRRVPVVDEFALRILKLSERIQIRRLGSYLGLSQMETNVVVDDLVRRGLIVTYGDSLELHPSSHEHFRAGDEDGIKIMETDAWTDRLWFDLVSRNMMRPDRSRPLSNGIQIAVDGMALGLPTEFAREAFQANFSEYIRDVRRVENPDRFSLYSISDVLPERFGSIMLLGSEGLLFEPQPRLVPQLLDVEIHQSARYRPLSVALLDAYRSLKGAEPTGAGFAEFRRLTGATPLGRELGSENDFDLNTWFGSDAANRASGRQTVFGSPYVERNRGLFIKMLEEHALPLLKERSESRFELVWFRPGGTKWGVSPDLQEMIIGIRNCVRHALPRRVRFTSTLVTPKSHTYAFARFERIFDGGVISPRGFLSPSVEVILLRGVAAMVLVAVRISRTISTSVGYVITDRPGVALLEEAIGWDEASKRSERRWTPPADDATTFAKS
ncbi:hypothetical protein [Methylobacterium brachiatum]